MAPKAKYTKEMIINSAFELVREQGISALSARSLAKKMNASSQPIFTYFNNMEEVKAEVIKKAKEVYRNEQSNACSGKSPCNGFSRRGRLSRDIPIL